MEQNAAKLVSGAIIGMDFKTVVVNGKAYMIMPPTIKKIAGATYHLSGIKDGDSVRELFLSINDVKPIAHALSWFVQGNDDLYEEFLNGTHGELIDALETAYSLVSVQNFWRLSTLAGNVASLTARQKS